MKRLSQADEEGVLRSMMQRMAAKCNHESTKDENTKKMFRVFVFRAFVILF